MQARSSKRRRMVGNSAEEEELPDLTSCLGSCLNSFAELGDADQVSGLLDSNVPHSSDWLGFNALHLAAKHGHLPVCQVLLRHNFGANSRNKVARTPLHLACAGGYCSVVRLLLDCGADRECEDFLRNRPIHCACQANRPAVVELLLRSGADPHPVNKFGQTPLQVAQSMRHQDCASLLIFAASPVAIETSASYSATAPLPDVACLLGDEGIGFDDELSLMPDLGDCASVDGDYHLGALSQLQGDASSSFQFQAAEAACQDVQSEVIVEPDGAAAGALTPTTAATPGDLRLELEGLAGQAAGGQLCIGLPSGCGLAQVPGFLTDLGISVTASHGSSLLAWFLDSEGCVVNLRATHEAANSSLTLSAFKVDCQLLEHLQTCET